MLLAVSTFSAGQGWSLIQLPTSEHLAQDPRSEGQAICGHMMQQEAAPEPALCGTHGWGRRSQGGTQVSQVETGTPTLFLLHRDAGRIGSTPKGKKDGGLWGSALCAESLARVSPLTPGTCTAWGWEGLGSQEGGPCTSNLGVMGFQREIGLGLSGISWSLEDPYPPQNPRVPY